MDFSSLKKKFEIEEENLDLEALRKRLLDILLISSTLLGSGLYFFALGPALSNRLYPAVAVYTISYLWLIGITFGKRLPYGLRVNSWLFFLYVLGVVNLLYSGFNVDSGLFLLTYVAMNTLLYSFRAGMSAIALSLATIVLTSYLIIERGFVLQLALPQGDAMLWLIGGFVFLLMSILLATSFTVMVRGLATHLSMTTALAAELHLKNDALVESEARYRQLVETSPDAILLVDLDGKILMGNLASQLLLGFPDAEELIGWEIRDLMPGGPQGEGWNLDDLLKTGVYRDLETEMLRKDGRHIMVEFSASVIRNAAGEPQAVLGVGRNITKRKVAEWLLQKAKSKLEQRSEQLQASQVQLRKLAGQVITIHEEERRVISQELHDDAGQVLITLKHSLSSALEEWNSRPEAARERLERSLELVDRTMAQIRSLSHRVRPPALEVGGLNLSLMELCRECRQQTGLEINYSGKDLPGLPDDIAINLYRVAQEAITNILKHASASRVEVALGHKRGQIFLSILDDGKGGIADIQPQGGIGLFGMQERLNLLGGQLKVDVNRKHGYKLTALVPWKAPRRKTLR